MYLKGEETMGVCDEPAQVGFQANMFARGVVPNTPPLTANVRGSPNDDPVTLHGHTYLDRSFGAVLDGDRDFITFTDAGYTQRDFTISFWFAKLTACEPPGRWQFLYSEATDSEAQFFRAPSILLNPSAESTGSLSRSLRLALAVDPAKARICSDCVWFSRSPPPSLLTHMMNPVDGAAFKIDLGLSMPTV